MSHRLGTAWEFRQLRNTWERFGGGDPMGAVLVRPEAEEWNEAEFLSTGSAEVASLMAYIEELGIPKGRGRAVDFGCGLGRVTGPLGEHFDAVVGVDVAASMIEGAERLHPDASNIEFRHNPVRDLSCFESGSCDFVYSKITLQHMPPELAKAYMAEFVRILSSDGLALFQITTAKLAASRKGLSRRARRIARRMLGYSRHMYWIPRMQMYWIPPDQILDCVRTSGGRVVETRPDSSAGPKWESRWFAVAPEPG